MKKKYWLKGGMISLIVFGTLIILIIFGGRGSEVGGFFGLVLLFIAFPVIILERFFQFSFGPFSGFAILTIPYSFIFGSIVGCIYGKIKNRNKII